MMRIFTVAFSVWSILVVEGYHQPSSPREPLGRREALRRAYLCFGSASTTAFVTVSTPADAVISSKGCYSGEGEGCAELAEENALIKSLQEKSAANKERNTNVRFWLNERNWCNFRLHLLPSLLFFPEQEARDAYYMKNYPDWFATVGKTMVKRPDGTFVVVTEQELEQLKRQNMLTLEYPKSMGGRVSDMTQKPILVLKE
jgi:hypothetical protein